MRLSRKMLALRPMAWVLACISSACAATGPDHPVTWGSAQAILSIAEDTATVQILASGGCYGSYGVFDHAIVSGTFELSGTYTQLVGVYPGSIQYAATYTGAVVDGVMTLSINVPALQQTIGPFRLRAGVTSSWSACRYP